MSDRENNPASDKATQQGSAGATSQSAAAEGTRQGKQESGSWLNAALSLGNHSEEYAMMSLMLSTAVPLWIQRFLNRGGVTPEDFKRVAGYNDDLGLADNLLFHATREGEVASFFNKFAEAIAVLSFVPGGIELFGLRYESLPLQHHMEQMAGHPPFRPKAAEQVVEDRG